MDARRRSDWLRAGVLGLLCLVAPGAPAQAAAIVLADGPPPDAADNAELIGLRQLGAAEGLPQMTVFALAEDADGYVYAGTQDGLARWDGRRFGRIALPGERRDWVTHLWSSAEGLWIGTDENGLFRRQGDEVLALVDQRGQTLPSVEAITAASNGGVWVGTPVGLYRCSAMRCVQQVGTEEHEVAELIEADGALWVGTNLDGLYRFDVGVDGDLRRSPFRLSKEHGLPNGAIRALAVDARQRLWIGTGRGMARWDGTTLMRWMSGDHGPPAGIYGLRRLPDGSLLAATVGGGLGQFRMDDGYRMFGLADGLPDSYLHSLLLSGDAEDPIVWLGSGSSGVLRLESGRWRSFDERHGLPQRVVVGVGEARLDEGPPTLWAGTLGGAVRWTDGHWTPLLPPPYERHVVYDVLRDPTGNRWYGTNRGLLLESAGQWREFTAERDQLPATSAEHLLWFDNRIWVGTGHGLATIENGRVRNALDATEDYRHLGVSTLLAVEVPGRGRRLLLGGSRGPLLSDGKQVEALAAACTPHGLIYDIEPLANGDLWLATRSGVLRLRWRGGDAQCTPLIEPGGASTVYEIATDPLGRIYLFGYSGVRRIDALDKDGFPAKGSYQRFGLNDGLPALEFNRDAHVDDRGRVWAANAAGLVMFDTRSTLRAPRDPALVLGVGYAGAGVADGARLPALHGELEFAPRLLSFRHEHRIRYRYQLHGLDAAPGPWVADGDRRYQRLPDGAYRFQVEAMDAAGNLHGPAGFDFTVAAPWWLHPLALLAAALALLAAGLLAGRVRARALAARAAQLEALVAERTRALEHASSSDPLTGAWNRRYFYTHIGAWLRETEHTGGLLLLLVDIDHFKLINDQHGHAAGDAVLVQVAERLRRTEGERSVLIRWGGEEFLLVLRDAMPATAAARVAAVLHSVADTPIAIDGKSLQVRCSIGYTRCRPPSEGFDPHIDLLISRADGALYQAKRRGRNQAVESGA
jgi:diguanylate cyclase (GGDEF)-like protein